MNKRRIVLVGLGRMGRNHLRVILESDQFELAGIVEPRPLPAQDPKLDGIPAWKNIGQCLASDISFDCAVVATPTQSHFDAAQELISAGKHLLVEKPLAATHAQATLLANLARTHRTALVTGHLERLNPAVRKLREVLQFGWIGDPIHFAFTRVGGYPEGNPKGNNVLMDLAVHDIDVLHFLSGSQRGFEIKGVVTHETRRPGVADTADLLLERPGSMSASIHANWITPGKIRTVRVTGTRGICTVDYILQTCVFTGGALGNRGAEPKVAFEDLLRLYKTSDTIEFGIEREEPLKIQLREFAKVLNGASSEACTAEEAVEAVRIAEQALSNGGDRRSRQAGNKAA